MAESGERREQSSDDDMPEALEDELWATRASQAVAGGFASDEETSQLFCEILGPDTDASESVQS